MSVKKQIQLLIDASEPTHAGMKTLADKVYAIAGTEKADKLAEAIRWALKNPRSIFVFNELQKALKEYEE